MEKVITYGTFDLLHYGHINLLERSKDIGDYLIVGPGHGDGSFVPLCKQIPINCLPTMNGDEVRRGEEAPEEPNNQNLG